MDPDQQYRVTGQVLAVADGRLGHEDGQQHLAAAEHNRRHPCPLHRPQSGHGQGQQDLHRGPMELRHRMEREPEPGDVRSPCMRPRRRDHRPQHDDHARDRQHATARHYVTSPDQPPGFDEVSRPGRQAIWFLRLAGTVVQKEGVHQEEHGQQEVGHDVGGRQFVEHRFPAEDDLCKRSRPPGPRTSTRGPAVGAGA